MNYTIIIMPESKNSKEIIIKFLSKYIDRVFFTFQMTYDNDLIYLSYTTSDNKDSGINIAALAKELNITKFLVYMAKSTTDTHKLTEWLIEDGHLKVNKVYKTNTTPNLKRGYWETALTNDFKKLLQNYD